jgi:hypothetical protein
VLYFFHNEMVISHMHHCIFVVDGDYNSCDLF